MRETLLGKSIDVVNFMAKL